MKKYLKRLFGSKRALTWAFNQAMTIILFIKIYREYKVDFNILILFGMLSIIKLTVLGLIDFEKIKIEYKKEN